MTPGKMCRALHAAGKPGSGWGLVARVKSSQKPGCSSTTGRMSRCCQAPVLFPLPQLGIWWQGVKSILILPIGNTLVFPRLFPRKSHWLTCLSPHLVFRPPGHPDSPAVADPAPLASSCEGWNTCSHRKRTLEWESIWGSPSGLSGSRDLLLPSTASPLVC